MLGMATGMMLMPPPFFEASKLPVFEASWRLLLVDGCFGAPYAFSERMCRVNQDRPAANAALVRVLWRRCCSLLHVELFRGLLRMRMRVALAVCMVLGLDAVPSHPHALSNRGEPEGDFIVGWTCRFCGWTCFSRPSEPSCSRKWVTRYFLSLPELGPFRFMSLRSW